MSSDARHEKAIAQDFLASLQGEKHIREVYGSVFLAGIGHSGVKVSLSQLPKSSNWHVMLEVS